MNDRSDVEKIVEEKDANDEEKRLQRSMRVFICLNPSFYATICRCLRTNRQNEYYLTDLIALAHRDQRRVKALLVNEETYGRQF